jgi:hypothetical protein
LKTVPTDEDTLRKLLIVRAEEGLRLREDDAISFPAGHNGPYFDEETPVRNTAHWLMIFATAYKQTGERKYLRAVESCATYLMSKEARPFGKTFHHRKSILKDECNGLVGQAWTIEALVEAWTVLGSSEYLEVARSVFKLHPFSESKGLWERVSPEGICLGFDNTFNHQLWFCMAGALLFRALSESDTSISTFFEKLSGNILIASNGRIHQAINSGFVESRVKPFLKNLVRREQVKYMKDKEVGYHAFNMYAFACLFDTVPDSDFWFSSQFNAALHYLANDEYIGGIFKSKYGFPYNPPGYEVAYVYKIFKKESIRDVSMALMALQLAIDFHGKKDSGVQVPCDKLTNDARFYEAVRILS